MEAPGPGGFFGDMEVLFLQKDIRIEQKEFCFEYKENAHHQFMLISSLNDHSILIPSKGLTAFLDVLEGFCSGSENNQQKKKIGKPKQLKIDDKVEFRFKVGQNKWGHFLKVWEASTREKKNSIFIPSESNGWEHFRKTLAELDDTAKQMCPPFETRFDPLKRPNKVSDTKVDSTDSPSAENLTVPELKNIEPSQNDNTGIGELKMLRVGLKRFYFDLGSNKKGNFLKISEVTNGYRSSVIIPSASVQQFHEMVGHFIRNNNETSASTSKHSGSGR